MNIKVGDRVYFRAIYSRRAFEGYGTVEEVHLGDVNSYDVRAEKARHSLGSTDLFHVEPDLTNEYIIDSRLISSPLWKAIS